MLCGCVGGEEMELGVHAAPLAGATRHTPNLTSPTLVYIW